VTAADQRELAGLIDKRLIGMLGLRPLGSPGWGMLRAVKSGAFTSERDPGERCTITAGKTQVAYDYWLARERPELFMPIDKRDTRTIDAHSRNLERTRHELERGRTRASGPARPRSGVLPPRTGGSTLRLPGGPSGARPLRLPR
jgi:hypothetical protein